MPKAKRVATKPRIMWAVILCETGMIDVVYSIKPEMGMWRRGIWRIEPVEVRPVKRKRK